MGLIEIFALAQAPQIDQYQTHCRKDACVYLQDDCCVQIFYLLHQKAKNLQKNSKLLLIRNNDRIQHGKMFLVQGNKAGLSDFGSCSN